MKSYIAEIKPSQQQNSPYSEVATQVAIGLLVDLIPVIASTIFAWLFLNLKTSFLLYSLNWKP